MEHTELVAALCTTLTFACSVQVLITCFLAFAFSQFMTILHCNLATAAGVISGLVTVPTVIQLRAAQISNKIGRKYGYTIWYKRLAIGICALLQVVTWSCTIVDICTPFDRTSFLRVMKEYGTRQCSKSIVDNIQWFLQCCGSRGFEDWYGIDWGGYVFDTIHMRKKKSIKELLYGDTDLYPDTTGIRTDVVPFSCCAENAKTACVHQNLEQFGSYTINTQGCTGRLAGTKQSILWTELLIYTVCLSLEITILFLLKNGPHASPLPIHKEQQTNDIGKHFHKSEESEFSKFVNESS